MKIFQLALISVFILCSSSLFGQVAGLSNVLRPSSNFVTSNKVKTVEVWRDSVVIYSFGYSADGKLISYCERLDGGIIYSENYDKLGNTVFSCKTSLVGDTLEAIYKKYNAKNKIVYVNRFHPGSFGNEYGGESLIPANKIDSFFYNNDGVLIGHKSYWDKELYVNTSITYGNDSTRTDLMEYRVQDILQVYRVIEIYNNTNQLLYRKKFVRDYYDSSKALVDSLNYDNGLLVTHKSYDVSAQGWRLRTAYLFQYDQTGKMVLEQIIGSNPRTLDYRYDDQGRLIMIREDNGTDSTITKINIDKAGHITYHLAYRGKYRFGYRMRYNKSDFLTSYEEIQNNKTSRKVKIRYDKKNIPQNASITTQTTRVDLAYHFTFY